MTLRRHVRLFVGLVVIGEGIALNVRSELGLGPLIVVFQGLQRHGVETIGIATILVNLVLLCAALLLRDRPGLGTLGQVFLVGPLADLGLVVTPHTHSTVVHYCYLGAALVALSVGSALYLSAALGAGPWDAVMRGIYRNVRRLSLSAIRIALEGTALLAGWLLGGDVGIGTLIIGLGIGPGIAIGLRLLGAMPDRHHASLQAQPKTLAG
jgi:uncharacterized membrane protein YczE